MPTRSSLARLALLTLAVPLAVMAADVHVNQLDVNLGTRDNSTTQSEVNLASFGSTVVVAWNDTQQFATGGLGGLTSIMGYGYSQDGGASFTDAGMLPSPGTGLLNLGDPALAVNRTGTFYYAALAGTLSNIQNIVIASSTATTPAVTFGAPVTLARVDAAAGVDKQFIAVDTSGGAFDGRVYAAWSEFGASGSRIAFDRSTGTSPLSFAAPINLSPVESLAQGTMPAVGPGGEVYVVWGRFNLAGGTNDLRIVKSTNGGVSFANPDPGDASPSKLIASFTQSPGTLGSLRARGFPRIAVDRSPFGSPTRGNVYVVSHGDPDGAGADRTDVFFSRSTDGGRTWSRSRSIVKGPAVTAGADTTNNDNWMPAVAVAPNGQLSVTFYDRREDAGNSQIRLYRAVSTDGGLTWFDEPISDVSFTPNTSYDPLTAAGYMGDYNDATADASNVKMVWGDLRNTCAPPPGAVAPCSPSGRSDQDVYFGKRDHISGADLLITPWGNVTGVGPAWQSPDIFVVDGGGNAINAAKGQLNRLRARVRNLGNAAASGVLVRFKFAPWFVGITDAAFKEIGTVTTDFAAGGDLSGNDLKVVPVTWDLTDLTDTNGGQWPAPISSFDHFCVKVTVEFAADANQGNNLAQSNFFDVPTITGSSLARFIVGNPFDREVEAHLNLSLPRGFKAELKGFDGFGKPFKLKPGELRLAEVRFTAPDGLKNNPPKEDLVADINLQIGAELVGGISFRLVRGQSTQESKGVIPGVTARFDAPSDKLFEAILRALKERRIGVSLADRERGLINSVSVNLSREQLLKYLPANLTKAVGENGGRFLVSFNVAAVQAQLSEVTVRVLFITQDDNERSPLYGTPLASNGVLEKELLELIRRAL